MSFVAPGRTFRLTTRFARAFAALTGSLALAVGGLVLAGPAMAADQPKVPQEVADYFANGLIPRLNDLYGAGDGVNKGIDFDATTTVGPISRVLAWTPAFLAGKPTSNPTQLTNTWVAPVSVRSAIIGLATVWINPATDLPELATLEPPALAARLGSAPAKTLLIHDADRGTWFAIDGEVLTPLVVSGSTSLAVTTPKAYQATITTVLPAEQESVPSGVILASIVLGVVVIALVVFVLLPLRRVKDADASAKSNDEPQDSVDADLQGDDDTA